MYVKEFFLTSVAIFAGVAVYSIYDRAYGDFARLEKAYQQHLIPEYSVMICHVSANSDRALWTAQVKACFDGIVDKARDDVDAAAR